MAIIIAAIILAFGLIVGAELLAEAVERTGKELGSGIRRAGIGVDAERKGA